MVVVVVFLWLGCGSGGGGSKGSIGGLFVVVVFL